ncbi:MAG: aldehyde ferredoxin oxidoreductase family protein [Candidatus Bipolaricaulota bacterium]
MNGVWNKLLRVDLSNGKVLYEPIGEEMFERYVGGSGLATRYLYEEVPPGTDPLSSDNKIIFATGPFQGTSVPGSAKWSVVSRSPLTETFSVSTAGAEWGIRFKRTGLDLLIIEGKSRTPVFLWLTDDGAEIRRADQLWGADAIDTVDKVKNIIGEPTASVATVGPGGETGVGCACITADKHSFAGRTGLGAVMGSKNLKAIAVKGGKSVPVADPEGLKELNRELFSRIGDSMRDTYNAHGTPGDLMFCEQEGDLPIKNWEESSWTEGAKKISAPRFTEELQAESWPCLSCSIGCHRRITTEYKGESIQGAGAEYETLGMIGSNCLIDDLKALSKANDLCNRLGLDTISAGSYAAFTMECYEKGLIPESELGGLRPTWGNADFVLNFISEVGTGTGFGRIFDRGFESATEFLGTETKELAVQVKNLSFPAHDPRTHFSLAINYATSPRGACHLRGYPHIGELGIMLLPEIGFDEPPEKFCMKNQAKLTAVFQDLATLHDSLVICIFQPIAGMTLSEVTQLFNSITGRDHSPKKLMEAGERGFTLQRLINVNDGVDRSADRLPPKMFQPGKTGKRKGKTPEPFEKTLLEYYSYRGWNSNGIPTNDTLRRLKLVNG